VVLISNTDSDWFKSSHVTFLATRLEECESYNVRATRRKKSAESVTGVTVIQLKYKTGNSPSGSSYDVTTAW